MPKKYHTAQEKQTRELLLGIFLALLFTGAFATADSTKTFTFLLLPAAGLAIYLILDSRLLSKSRRLILITLVVIFTISAIFYYYHKNVEIELSKEKDELSKPEGVLVPAKDKTPDFRSCIPPTDTSLIIFLGRTVAWVTKTPFVLLSMGQEPLLIIDRDSTTGDLKIIKLEVFDDRDDSIVSFRNGKWSIMNGRKDSPDKSTLDVYDHYDHQIFHIRYLNNHALFLTGVFRAPGSAIYTVTPTGSRVGNGGLIGGMCLQNIWPKGIDIQSDPAMQIGR